MIRGKEMRGWIYGRGGDCRAAFNVIININIFIIIIVIINIISIIIAIRVNLWEGGLQSSFQQRNGVFASGFQREVWTFWRECWLCWFWSHSILNLGEVVIRGKERMARVNLWGIASWKFRKEKCWSGKIRVRSVIPFTKIIDKFWLNWIKLMKKEVLICDVVATLSDCDDTVVSLSWGAC